MSSHKWQEILSYIEKNIEEPHRTNILTLCKDFESVNHSLNPNLDKVFFKLESTPKPKRQSKQDIQNKIVAENPNAGNLQNILKGF
jgi:hypothetical protein